MTDRPAFAAAMAGLALALPGRELSDALLELYWRALADLDDHEFARAAETAIRRCRFFPTPAELLGFARPPRVDSHAAAGRVYLQAQGLTEYCPNTGTWWSAERIRATLGEAAYQAFHACGGSAGFRLAEDPYHGPRVRREFVECFQRVVAAEPQAALPAPSRLDRTPEPVRVLSAGIGQPWPGQRAP